MWLSTRCRTSLVEHRLGSANADRTFLDAPIAVGSLAESRLE
jgi:hypothetical protein